MSDDFERQLREHLHREAQQTREFPRRLRGRIRDGSAPRARTPLAPQLALAGALVLVAVAVLAVRNPTIINVVTSPIKQIFQTTPAPPQPFICNDRSGGSSGLSTQLTDIRVASHESGGYDRIVFDFSNGLPSYDLTRQDMASFVRDASGQPVTLDGSAGLKLVFRDTEAGGSVSTDVKPALEVVREIAQTGNFERVLSYGVGLSSSNCVRVLEVGGPSRLVVDVATSTAAASGPPTALPIVPAATDLGPFTCEDRSGGTPGSPVTQLSAVRVAHQPGYDRIVFEFAAPAGVSSRLPAYTLSRQASAHFVKDPSGQPVTMRGSYGLRVVFQQATGAGSYSGGTDLTPLATAVVREVEHLGDFEAVLSWGAGLSRESCLRTLELSNPTRLVIDVQTP